MNHIVLEKGWFMREYGTQEWLSTEVPCTVYSTLLKHKKMKDPYERMEEYKARELMNQDYEFKTNFFVSGEIVDKQSICLVCYGLDTIADIYINDKKIGDANNMHRTWRFDVKSELKVGENELLIHFHSPLRYIKEKMSQSKDEIHYIPAGGTEGNSFIRKAHCMFGWDWGPQLPDAGIFRRIELEAYDDLKIEDVKVEQEHQQGQVTLSITSILKKANDTFPYGYQLSVKVIGPDGTIQSLCKNELQEEKSDSKSDGKSLITVRNQELIHNPMLWWPNGYGKQPLYQILLELQNEKEEIVDYKEVRIGLRTLTISTEKDQWGNEFCFTVNGIKIFAMGADYIPEDSILPRVTKERTEELIRQCVKANFNTLRVWGGGYYPEDFFYDLCDEYGLIIWQDLMYACNVYSLTKEFEENIVEETYDNVKRFRNHACLGAWCGNNEIESAWADWGWWKNHSRKLMADYIKQFEYLLPNAVEKETVGTFYWPSSPSSGGCFDNTGDENRGDVHYWDVWHGQKPFSDYKKYYFRFCSEFGFQSFPCLKTVKTYTLPTDRNIFSKVMESHQKNDAANGKILYYISDTFQYPKNFSSLLYISQVLQALAIQYGVEHWRRNRGRCMGAIYWQLNDCWPVASWSSIDYYGRWKLLHYAAKKFFAPQLISVDLQEYKATFYLHNEGRNPYEGEVRLFLKTMRNECVWEETLPVTCEPLSAMNWKENDFTKVVSQYGSENLYLQYQLLIDDKVVSENTALFDKPKYVQYLPCNYSVTVEETEEEFQIHVDSDVFAQYVSLDMEKFDVVFSDNFFSICGEEGITVTIAKEEAKNLTVQDIKENLTIESIADSYSY